MLVLVGGVEEAAPAQLVDGVDVCAVLDQLLDGGHVTLGARPEQRRHPVFIPRFNVRLANL